VALFAANCLIVCVCVCVGRSLPPAAMPAGARSARRGPASPLRNNPLCPAELPDGNSVDSRRATLPKATQHAVGPGRPAVASLLRAHRRFTASASPRSPGRFRAPRQPFCCEPADALQRQRARCRPGAFARPGNQMKQRCTPGPTRNWASAHRAPNA
jgi:hypothetical protein